MKKIHFITPYSYNKNLGKAYNDEIQYFPDEDYICLMDGDTMFMNFDFGHKLQKILKEHPEPALFSCKTNRIQNMAQLYKMNMSENPNIIHHRRIANVLWDKYGTKVTKLPEMGLSGFMMLFPKAIWNKVKFHEIGMLKVDISFTRKVWNAGFPVYIMDGLYMFHYYRLCEGFKYTKHLTVDKKLK